MMATGCGRRNGTRDLLTVMVLACAVGGAAAAAEGGVACDVPSVDHPTLGAAVVDVLCQQIVLASGTYPESVLVSRSLAIDGQSSSVTTLRGRLVVAGAGTVLTLGDLRLESGCDRTLQASGGATVDSRYVDVLSVSSAGCPPLQSGIFSSSFESGEISDWSERSEGATGGP